jgi:hypothetical protein
MSKRPISPAAVIVALLLSSSPAWGGELLVRLQGVYLSPSATLHVEGENPDQVAAKADHGDGVLASLEYRFHRRLGAEVAVLRGRFDATLSLNPADLGLHRAADRLRFEPWMLGLDVHLTPDRPVDLYLGPRLAHVRYGRASFAFTDIAFRADYDLSADNAFGGFLGLDVPHGRWSVGLGVLYLPTTAKPRGADAALDVDMVAATLGVGYRFGGGR